MGWLKIQKHEYFKNGTCAQKRPLLDTQNKLAKMQQTQPLKIYPPGKLKQLLVIFILNHINSLLIMQKNDIDM